MKALVTGAAGFVGRHLVEHLRACGDDVVEADHRSGPDLLDADAWPAYLADHRPEAVYHLAGQTSVAASWHDPRGTLRVNAEGTLNVLGACAGAEVARVLVVSSADVYGTVTDADLPLRETSPVRPVTPYAASKAAAEQVACQAFLGYAVPVLVARAFNHTGPGQDPRFVAPALAERVARNELTGEDVVPIGDLSARRDITDVRDVVRAYRLLVEAGRPGETYQVCSGRDRPIAALAEALLARARRPMRLEIDPALLRPVEVPALRGSHEKIEREVGWRPLIPFDATIDALLEEARARARAGVPAS
jgi:GDP-4-dehydro-6-deoxy-D-mannose reductase